MRKLDKILELEKPKFYKRLIKDVYKKVADRLISDPEKEQAAKVRLENYEWITANKTKLIDLILNKETNLEFLSPKNFTSANQEISNDCCFKILYVVLSFFRDCHFVLK